MSLLAVVVVVGMSIGIPAAALGGAVVDIHSYRFQPGMLTLHVGDAVTWTNHDKAAHDVTFTDSDVTSGPLSTGESWTFTFAEAGTVTYLCQLHPDMTGTIQVLPIDEPSTSSVTTPAASPLPPTSSVGPEAAPAPAPSTSTNSPQTQFSLDRRLLLAALLSGVVVFCALLLGRNPANA